MLEFYKLNEKNRATDSWLQEHSEGIKNLASIIACLVENEQMQQALELQDESDRNTIALMGYKEPQSSRPTYTGGAQVVQNSSVIHHSTTTASPNLENRSADVTAEPKGARQRGHSH